ncbi:MAG: 2-amino-4-hydroxy-6-hydroxymethyldihydropteridine diphosphokinase [Polyangia bacterium]
MHTYLGLGSNLGDRRKELERALVALDKRAGRIEAVSALYQTRPEGGAAEPDYLNAAVRVETRLPPRALLEVCLAIERAQGRIRPAGTGKGPRTLDIDILLYGAEVIREEGLRVPHARLLLRSFVRIPLAEVALPQLRHPVSREALDRCDADPAVIRLDLPLSYRP